MTRVTVALAIVFGLGAAVALAHEERLLVGRVDVVQPDRKLLVVSEAPGGQRRRLEIDTETTVLACRTGRGFHALEPGASVRVSYIDRVGARPEALSILVLRPPSPER